MRNIPLPPSHAGLGVVCTEAGQGSFAFQVGSGLIVTVDGVDILDELAVEQVQGNSLGADPAAFAAVRATPGHMEGTNHMEHLLFERVHVCFLRTVKLIAVEYTFTAAACRTDITAGIAADTFA